MPKYIYLRERECVYLNKYTTNFPNIRTFRPESLSLLTVTLAFLFIPYFPHSASSNSQFIGLVFGENIARFVALYRIFTVGLFSLSFVFFSFKGIHFVQQTNNFTAQISYQHRINSWVECERKAINVRKPHTPKQSRWETECTYENSRTRIKQNDWTSINLCNFATHSESIFSFSNVHQKNAFEICIWWTGFIQYNAYDFTFHHTLYVQLKYGERDSRKAD